MKTCADARAPLSSQRQLAAQAAEAAADRVRSASQPARRASGAWVTPARHRLSGASSYRAPATSPPMASLRERLEMRRLAREAEQSADGDGGSSDDEDDDADGDDSDAKAEEAAEAEAAAMATSPPRGGLTTPKATPGRCAPPARLAWHALAGELMHRASPQPRAAPAHGAEDVHRAVAARQDAAPAVAAEIRAPPLRSACAAAAACGVAAQPRSGGGAGAVGARAAAPVARLAAQARRCRCR